MTGAGYQGGAPILGEGLALDLMNTFYAVRSKPAEGLASTEQATAWIQLLSGRLENAGAPSALEGNVSEGDLKALLALREAVRGVADAVVGGAAPSKEDLRSVNVSAAQSPHWTSIAWDGEFARKTQNAGAPIDQVLGALASDAIDLFTGEDAARLRLCERPGCPLFFLKDHPRREWCTPACGARVRAARAYDKRVRRQRIGSPS